jgi:uncharacterized protein (DUF2235 family)
VAKSIIFCADGTWDDATSKTNVYKFYTSLTVTGDQIPLYDDGVGADGMAISRALGGAFGEGLWNKAKDGYKKIAHLYEAGDAVYLFGFSRGAFTARSLAGMIAACGLPTRSFDDELVETVFAAYRDKANRAALLAKLANNSMVDAKITMLGVWDTVGSLGIPAAVGLVDHLTYGFLDTGLHPDVLHAYHAMAIDERRMEFPVTPWTGDPAPGQTVEQVWFAGVHSDVGGGEPEGAEGSTTLSDITLGWMMNKASKLGLTFDSEVAAHYKVPLDPRHALDTLHASWSAMWGFPRFRPIPENATIANSVIIRYRNDQSYRPANLKIVDGIPLETYVTYDVVDELPVETPTSGAEG